MKTNRNLWMALSAALLLAIPLISRGDDVPGVINYQGRLTDTLGNPITSGYYEIKFLLWDDAVQNGAANLIWGRTFALHVVQDGLFNVQLSDGGSLVTQPYTPVTNQLLGAFEGPRWLGLTITVSNNLAVSGPEISPRQQLASAPFALQAQTANAVVTGGIQDTMLRSESVTAPKIATGAVTTDKIGDSQVTTAKIGDNQVTTAKIGDSQVTTAKIADGAVTLPKVGFNVAVLDANQTFTGQNTFTGSTASPVIFVNNTGTENLAAKFEMNGANLIFRSAPNSPTSKAAVIENTGANSVIALNPSGGRVGIGTLNPGYPLEVIGSVLNGNQSVSIACDKKMQAEDFNVVSDARIKEVIGRSDSRQDLQTMLGIEITDYRMKDRVKYGNEQFKKVIAQQVERIFPQAVSSDVTDVVPDIYTQAEAKAGWIPLENKSQPELIRGDKVRLIVAGRPQLFDVEEANASGFRVKSSVNGPVFVYGRQVHDFRTVNYSAISMLNVSVAQELYRRLVASEQAVAKLQEQNQDLQARLVEVEERESKQMARFTALEKLVRESQGGVQQASLK